MFGYNYCLCDDVFKSKCLVKLILKMLMKNKITNKDITYFSTLRWI